MALSKNYNPEEIEDKWYSYWTEKKYFQSKPNHEKESYTIVIPPPNVTGVLHMGHMLNNTIQDILIRKARMQGKEACWVPGTDHASIATEAKVVKMLSEKGIDKSKISREDFLKHCWEWTENYGGIILQQLKKLGASCDWSRTAFTMDDDYYKSVIKVFVDLHEKGLIYRGYRMVNWDPKAKTAVSDEEVIYKEVQSKLYSVKYYLEDSQDYLVVATTRPETILGDTAICVHPADERYIPYHGKKVRVPLTGRTVKVITDDYVDAEFGTGILKITPAHDINDYEIGTKHGLEIIDVLDDSGKMNALASGYEGMDRFECRKQTAKDLKEKGLLEKEEEYTNKVGFSERTDEIIEPKLSVQWFLKMKELAQPALQAVMKDEVKLHPPKFKNTYRHWMENVRDWCVSRQLWWGHRIPAFYYGDSQDNYVVAESLEQALKQARIKSGNSSLSELDLKQDEDVLDTWASSWLWPIAVFNGVLEPDNEEVNYYYPTADLVTAPEILFFWVARMIIAGYEYRDTKPFNNVYLTGIVRDSQRRKMSKSLGNSPDPIELIRKYGADGVRTGMLFSSPAGNDLLFDEKLCEQGRNFSNKIWNAFRLIDSWKEKLDETAPKRDLALNWMQASFMKSLVRLEDHFSKYRLSDALMEVYQLIWSDFCSWFLEMMKPAKGGSIHPDDYDQVKRLLSLHLKVLHPFMPFITEELFQQLGKEKDAEALTISQWPTLESYDEELIIKADKSFKLISEIRKFKAEKGLPESKTLSLLSDPENRDTFETFNPYITKLAKVESIDFSGVESEIKVLQLLVETHSFYIPMSEAIDLEAEKKSIKEEIIYLQGFLKSINKKLSNEKFVNNAPAPVIEKEKKKQADAESKIKSLEHSLQNL